LAKLVDHVRLVVFEDDQIHRSPRVAIGRGSIADFLKFLLRLLHAEGLNLIDLLEHLPLEADELCSCFAKSPIVVG
jgi:hypothetical protein